MHYIIMLLGLLLASCGKKPRSLIPQQQVATKPHTFNVPRATQLRSTHTGRAIQLHWKPIHDARLHSYAVYKFARGRFVRHKPYAIVQAPQSFFCDDKPYHHYQTPCYAIRPCYLIDSYICMGALSNVLCFSKKMPETKKGPPT